tara:strand:+ start:473 stop:604 length:132 start_codon:yes stop_codon:yes gene_type:complete
MCNEREIMDIEEYIAECNDIDELMEIIENATSKLKLIYEFEEE